MRTIGKVLLVGLVVCLLLGGCGKAQEKQVSFMIFGEPAEVAAYQTLVDAFQAKYPTSTLTCAAWQARTTT